MRLNASPSHGRRFWTDDEMATLKKMVANKISWPVIAAALKRTDQTETTLKMWSEGAKPSTIAKAVGFTASQVRAFIDRHKRRVAAETVETEPRPEPRLHRAIILPPPVSTTARVFGDPLPGRSALDRPEPPRPAPIDLTCPRGFFRLNETTGQVEVPS